MLRAEVASSQPAVLMTSADTVEVHVVDVPLTTVLRMLSTQSRRNIIASSGVQGSVTADLFDVNFFEALDSILAPNNCGYVQRGSFIHVYTLKELSDQQAAAEGSKLTARLFHLNYVTTDDVEPIIKPLLSSDGKLAAMPEAGKSANTSSSGSSDSGSSSSDSGGSSDQLGQGNFLTRPDCLMVCDYPDRLVAVEKVLREVDVRPRQVLIEATILRASLGESNSLGIDFNVVGGVNFQELSAKSPGVTDLTVGNLPANQYAGHSWTTTTDFNDLVPDGGFTFGIIHNDVAAFIRALEAVTDATVLANPKVLTLNKQEGHVIVGRRDGYLTTTVTETVATQNVEFLETGTRLFFRPFISSDGFVRMEIHPEDSSGGINEQNLPYKRTTEVTTNIMVRDGCTVLIGGLFREAISSNKSQVPYAGNIPVAGALLGTTTDATEREEVIILLTVHVIQDDIYAEKSAQVAADVDRVAMGMRKNLMPHGRARLSEAHYRWATQHEEAGHMNRALWDARLAAQLDPTNLQAIKLKDRLLQQDQPEAEETLVRDFIKTRLQAPCEPAVTRELSGPTTRPALAGVKP